MNKFCSIFLLWLCCYHTVFASVDYSWVSTTTSGEPCLNTCKNGLCAVDYQLNIQPCIANDVAGVPVYFTSMDKGPHSRCLSNCAKFGYTYEWCFTTEEYNWDYCSSRVRSPSNVYGYDIYGNRCTSECFILGPGSKCHTEVGSFQTCAIPARVPVQSWLNLFPSRRRTTRALDRIFSPALCSKVCMARVRDGRDGHTQGLIDGIYSSGMNVENVTSFDRNSPYTFVATRNSTNNNGNLAYLPVIIQGTIRQLQKPVQRQSSDITTAARNNVNNMYNGMTQGIDVGHIIGFQNGGTRDLFNYVGQTSALNKGPYKVIENEINNWINFGGTAKLTVVVVYSGTKPSEFAVKLKLFNSDGSLHSNLQDIILLNI